jgi:hypothetical protein
MLGVRYKENDGTNDALTDAADALRSLSSCGKTKGALSRAKNIKMAVNDMVYLRRLFMTCFTSDGS